VVFLPLAVKLYIVESGAVGQARRVAEAVPVDVLPRLRIAVEGNVFGFAGLAVEMLPLHSEHGDVCG